MSIQFLKVKIKSLAEEARIIRLEERRANKKNKYTLQASLREHRVGIVRHEVRHTLLAYQYLRGKSFYSCQSKNTNLDNIDWNKVKFMIKRFGSWRAADDFNHEAWIDGVILSEAA